MVPILSCFFALCCCQKLHGTINILDFGALTSMGVAGSAVALWDRSFKGKLDVLLCELKFGCLL